MPRLGDWQQELAGPLQALQEELARVIGQFRAPSMVEVGSARWEPPIDLIEWPEEIHVIVDLPGVAADRIDLTVDGSILTIVGERPALAFVPPPASVSASPGREHLRERPRGAFHRQIPLPCAIEPDGVRAEARDGVLVVVLPKAESLRPRPIPIRSL